MGTALLAHLRRSADHRWSMTWTNAGHPPPILLDPSGTATVLEGHDILFGFPGLAVSPRRDLHHDVDPGSTVFLYTDGLVERRSAPLDNGLADLTAAMTCAPPQTVCAHLMDTLVGTHPNGDDIALLVLGHNITP
jgi:serine phosphatase RsbU (regulator of sigma subunit)